MSMRITKYPHLFGHGLDLHTVPPGSMPPMPPAPPNPAPIPMHTWAAILAEYRGALLMGKFTLTNCITEFMFDTLVGHDWGPGQAHIPLPPVLEAPNMFLLTLTSSHKYFLPAYSVQETPQGGALSRIGAGATPVAVSVPTGSALLQDCWDLVAPSGVGFHLPTTRCVGFGWGDLLAGLVLFAGDALAAFVSGKINDKLVHAIDNKLIRMIKASENKKKLWDTLVKGQKLMDAFLDNKWGLSGLVLGAANTAVANFASARFSSGDWGAADVVGIVVATPLGMPAISVITDKAASAIADPS